MTNCHESKIKMSETAMTIWAWGEMIDIVSIKVDKHNRVDIDRHMAV